MGIIIWGGVVPGCLVATWLIVRRPVRLFREELSFDRARGLFRLQRERLEARFTTAIGRVEPPERQRWEEAHWHDDVIWCRDRQTRSLLALVGVHFDEHDYNEYGEVSPRQATAIFEFRKGQWQAEGKWLDEIRPDDVMLRSPRFEPLTMHPLPRRRHD